MDSEGKFWISVWVLVAIVLSIFIMCVTAHNISKTNKVLEAIRLGAEPQAAACAINNAHATPVCVAYTAQLKR